MTIFGWDASHYDGDLDLATLKRARAEGIEFFTHKLGEGLGGEDATQGTALAAARDAGVTVLGGYWFCHNDDDPVAEARKCVATADKDEPWWRDQRWWFWQADCETETGEGKPTPGWIERFADALTAETGRLAVVYASHGEYGGAFASLGHPLWNASYGTNPREAFADAYPGDKGAGWGPWDGYPVPLFLQYGSNTTIAGKTTCDANAFRGTLAELQAIIEGGTVAELAPVDVTTAVWGLQAKSGDSEYDVVPNTSKNVADSPAATPPGTNDNTSAGYALGRVRQLAEDNAVAIAQVRSDLSAVKAQVSANGSSLSVQSSLLSGIKATVAQIPVTAVPAGPLSDDDVARIAKAVLDGFAARQQS